MKKYFITLFVSLFFFIFTNQTVKAEEGTCVIKQLDVSYSIDTPFYWYETQKVTLHSGMSVDSITYSAIERYVDTGMKCKSINNKKPTFETGVNNNFLNTRYSSFFFSKKKYTDNEEIFASAMEIFEIENPHIPTGKDYRISSTYLSLDNLPPVIVSDSLNSIIIASVDHPINTTLLKEKITAYDEVDGVIKVETFENNYTGNSQVIGDYTVIFSATDASDNTAYLTITISVRDLTKPTIEGSTSLKSYLSNPLTATDIKKSLIIKDNYDSNLESKLLIVENSFSPNSGKEGIYTMSFRASDNSNNISDIFVVTIESYDDVLPTLTGDTNYYISNKNKLDFTILNNQLSASDNIDPSPTIELKEENYSPNFYIPGIYQATYIAKDKNRNTSIPFTINITVQDQTKPVFYVSQKFIGVDSSTPISIESIIEIIETTNDVDKNNLLSFNVTKDTYSSNVNTPGTYVVELSYEYENNDPIVIETTIVVDNYYLEEVKEIKVKNNIFDFIKKILKKIWDFLKELFSFSWFK